MGGSSSPKSKLGKIALQRRLVTTEEADAMMAAQRKQGLRLASIKGRLSALKIPEDLRALCEQHQVPPVVLSQLVMTVGQLVLVPEEIAREHSVLPFEASDDEVYLAMATPWDSAVVEEIAFLTGKTIKPFVALPDDLRNATAGAYQAYQQGEVLYAGLGVSAEERDALGLRAAMPVAVTVPAAVAVDVGLHEAPTAPPKAAAAGAVAAQAVIAVAPPRMVGSAPAAKPAKAEPAVQEAETVRPRLDPAFSEPPLESSDPEPPPDLSDRSLLVVDVSGDVADALERELNATGVNLKRATSGSAAIVAVREALPDVLLLDAVLPELHGLDVCRRLRSQERFAKLPIVVFSDVYVGWRLEADLRDCYGVEALFEKPGDLELMARAVVRILLGQPIADAPGALGPGAQAELEKAMRAFDGGDLDVAIAHLEAGVRVEPTAFQLQYHLGLLYGRRDDLFGAIHALEAATRLQKRHFSALKNLAVVYQRAGFRRKSLETWERAMWTAPDDQTRQMIKEHMVALL